MHIQTKGTGRDCLSAVVWRTVGIIKKCIWISLCCPTKSNDCLERSSQQRVRAVPELFTCSRSTMSRGCCASRWPSKDEMSNMKPKANCFLQCAEYPIHPTTLQSFRKSDVIVAPVGDPRLQSSGQKSYCCVCVRQTPVRASQLSEVASN